MRDRLLIAAGLILFVAAVTSPFWRAAAAGTTAAAPELKLPAKDKTCIAPRDTMRAAHQKLLMEWREGAVREGKLNFTAYNGKAYRVGLSTTCLDCHTSKAEFCDRCHTYAGVSGPYCFDCHVDPHPPQSPAAFARRTP